MKDGAFCFTPVSVPRHQQETCLTQSHGVIYVIAIIDSLFAVPAISASPAASRRTWSRMQMTSRHRCSAIILACRLMKSNIPTMYGLLIALPRLANRQIAASSVSLSAFSEGEALCMADAKRKPAQAS